MGFSSCLKPFKFPKPAMETITVVEEEEFSTDPNWLDLPRDVTAMILHKLGVIEILLNAQNVCREWRKICKDPSMWRTIEITTAHNSYYFFYDLEKMFFHAVRLSCGHVKSIAIEFLVGSDSFVIYDPDSPDYLHHIDMPIPNPDVLQRLTYTATPSSAMWNSTPFR
ncbi:putative F-box domain-containing protein [Lupinus albus]|uniref:Putative F-box domain-containing protein n=1 Tax=Lupinus albus TaxID=3870 RepID=A0A6A4PC87_LUPAL|nr:putative F-box domain-containing protein [Lupinus albus]